MGATLFSEGIRKGKSLRIAAILFPNFMLLYLQRFNAEGWGFEKRRYLD